MFKQKQRNKDLKSYSTRLLQILSQFISPPLHDRYSQCTSGGGVYLARYTRVLMITRVELFVLSVIKPSGELVPATLSR